ncbi:propionyl-CoA carboxylase beta chain [Lachnospiraceae bacterium]|nr:propionyl-CoA carboxylase beta chain [Lachnospiraceae bacterium]
MSAKGCDKAAEFVTFCDAFDIPVLTLTNVKGYKATKCSEKKMSKAVARLTYAFANATVPKVNVITQKAYGSAYVAMNSKAIGADITMAWPDAEIGTMEAKLAAKIISYILLFYIDLPQLHHFQNNKKSYYNLHFAMLLFQKAAEAEPLV